MQSEQIESVDGVERNCQHPRMQAVRKSVETTSHYTGHIKYSGYYCPDCDQNFYIIGPDGRVREFAGVLLSSKLPDVAEIAKPRTPKPKTDSSLAKSKINRNGLKAGTIGPDFTLPTLDGSEVSLADFRGSRTLIVFSDTNCGPCETIARKLQELHVSGQKVLVISSGDIAAARAKADKFGLTHPIAMQKIRETATKYGTFYTPAGYMVGPDGVLESDVAIGEVEILKLVNQGE